MLILHAPPIFNLQIARDWSRAAIRLEPVILRRYETIRHLFPELGSQSSTGMRTRLNTTKNDECGLTCQAPYWSDIIELDKRSLFVFAPAVIRFLITVFCLAARPTLHLPLSSNALTRLAPEWFQTKDLLFD